VKSRMQSITSITKTESLKHARLPRPCLWRTANGRSVRSVRCFPRRRSPASPRSRWIAVLTHPPHRTKIDQLDFNMSTCVHCGDEPDDAEPLLVTMICTKKKKKVVGKMMAYMEVGTGDRIVFIHGNPTSSCMWQNILPHCKELGGLIAPDLIGMGDSDKLEKKEGIFCPRAISIFCCTDGGSARRRTRRAVKRHSHLSQQGRCHWFALGKQASRCVKRNLDNGSTSTTVCFVANNAALTIAFWLIKSCMGHHLVVRENIMIEKAIPDGVMRELSVENQRPFCNDHPKGAEARRPLPSFARAVPIIGDSRGFYDAKGAWEWLETSEIPKLLLVVDPGSSLKDDGKIMLRNLREVPVPGKHLITEDSPSAVGNAIASWCDTLK
jgi:haloalkane dehalogenase